MLKMSLGLVLFIMFGFLSAVPLYSQTVIPPWNIPKGSGDAYSKVFYVSNKGELKITVRVAVKGFFGSGGNSRYRVALVKGNREVTSKFVTTSTRGKNVYLRYVIDSCSKKGRYRIKVRNSSSTNPQPGVASTSRFYPPTSKRIRYTMPRFSLPQGHTITRDIPEYREPKGAGYVEFYVNFTSDCIGGCKIAAKLKSNNQTVAQKVGYPLNSLFPSRQRLRFTYNVPANRVGTDWKIEFIGSSSGNTFGVTPQFNFTPDCR